MTGAAWAQLQRINRRPMTGELIAARNRAWKELRAVLGVASRWINAQGEFRS